MFEKEKIIQYFNENNKDFKLSTKDNLISLISIKNKNWQPFSIDFSSKNYLRRKDQLNNGQEIVKAIGIKKNSTLKILDTTAGQGRDSFLLSSLGCKVVLLERNKIIFLLLNNAIENAKNNPELVDIVNRMTLINQDSITFLQNNTEYFDVIYIDPMFPKTTKSRLVKKDMQIFREIVGDDIDSSNILNLSLKYNTKKIVVKRMLKSQYLNNQKPSYSIKGKTIRFDIYLPHIK